MDLHELVRGAEDEWKQCIDGPDGKSSIFVYKLLWL